jgi:hypothetical protein
LGNQAPDGVQVVPLRQSTRNKGGLDSRIEPLRREPSCAIAAAHQDDPEDLQECKKAEKKLQEAAKELEAQMRGNAAAEGVSAAVWQSEFNAYAEGLEPARRKLATAIKACEEKQVKMMQRTVSSAVGRAIVTAQEAARSDDLVEIELASCHLSAKATEMEKLVTHAGGEASDQDKERLHEAEKSLRKLEARRQELAEDPDVGSSPQLDRQKKLGRADQETLPIQRDC